MIIPVRCFTCHKVLGDKWNYYKSKVDEEERKHANVKYTKENIKIDSKMDIYITDVYKGKILNDLGLDKICCRRHLLGHVDMMDLI
jgi:DNA-directed RNA polymerase subunit N